VFYPLFFAVGVDGQTYTITIVTNPVGTPVSGSPSTFDYPILSNVTLTCMADPSPPAGSTYWWNTVGCFTNGHITTPTCFPHDQTTQSVTGYHLLAKDAGIITCTVTIGGDDYTSEPLTLRISGTFSCTTVVVHNRDRPLFCRIPNRIHS